MRIVFLLVSITFIFGCKKDKLKDEKAVFVGKWRWVYTVENYSTICGDPPVITVHTPASAGKNYSIEFKEKGCVIFYEDNEKGDKYRTVFAADGWRSVSNPNYTNYNYFEFDLNNKPETKFSGYISQDTLIELGGRFPYKEPGGAICLDYTSYFIKE